MQNIPRADADNSYLSNRLKLFQFITSHLFSAYAAINVKSAAGGERRGIGRDFDIFKKIAVKFPTPGQKCEVKYNGNSPPHEIIYGHRHEQKLNYPYP